MVTRICEGIYHAGMLESASFTIADNWHGGRYELALELGPTSDERIQTALSALWTAADVWGCYARTDCEPADQPMVPCTVESLEQGHVLVGIVELPNSVPVICGARMVREDNGPVWLDFYIPLGALGHAESRVGAYPFDGDGGPSPQSLNWRQPIDDWLAHIGIQIYKSVDYQLGLIGWQASGMVYEAELTDEILDKRGFTYLIPTPDKMRYLPATF